MVMAGVGAGPVGQKPGRRPAPA